MKVIKGSQLKQDGIVIASGQKCKVIKYQEQHQRARVYTYIVTLHGERYCKIRRLTKKETQYYIDQIQQENERSKYDSN